MLGVNVELEWFGYFGFFSEMRLERLGLPSLVVFSLNFGSV